MKKILAAVMCMFMILSFTACGSKGFVPKLDANEEVTLYFVGEYGVLVHNSYNPESSGAWIEHDTYNEVRNKFGKEGVDSFITAMKKGLVGPEGQSGIKYFKSKINGIFYEFEIKVKNQFGDYRIFGNYDETLDMIIFNLFHKGKH